tara:strand:- start:1955 stop:2176 length:222 start_codon:yes stop_codon:yes gene_type:complete
LQNDTDEKNDCSHKTVETTNESGDAFIFSLWLLLLQLSLFQTICLQQIIQHSLFIWTCDEWQAKYNPLRMKKF